MEPVIQMNGICKEFKVAKRREGLRGSIRDLFSREYNMLQAVNNITMDIMPGEMVGYLGPNGAGKSTTIKMMTGILEPTKGQILVNGRVPYENRTKNAQDIGVVFGQRTQLWWALPVIESFKILKEIYGIPEREYKDNLEYYDDLVGAGRLYHKTVREMSLGQRTLCDILAAFLHNPRVVFMDEPTIGLDVSMKGKIRQLVGSLNEKKNTTVILTTHDMGDVDALCKRIVIIDKGTMIYDNDITKLQQYFGAYRTVKLQFGKTEEDLMPELLQEQAMEVASWLGEKFPRAKSTVVTAEDGWIQVLLNEEEVRLMKVINCIQDNRRIIDMSLQEISTESVIRKIYEGGMA